MQSLRKKKEKRKENAPRVNMLNPNHLGIFTSKYSRMQYPNGVLFISSCTFGTRNLCKVMVAGVYSTEALKVLQDMQKIWEGLRWSRFKEDICLLMSLAMMLCLSVITYQ